jgi:hypothetical protein
VATVSRPSSFDGLLHAGYSLLELAKLGLLAGAALLARR